MDKKKIQLEIDKIPDLIASRDMKLNMKVLDLMFQIDEFPEADKLELRERLMDLISSLRVTSQVAKRLSKEKIH